MSDPVRWKQGGAPGGLDDLLRRAPRPRAMSAAERARTAARFAQVPAASATLGAAWGAWAKGIAVVAGLGVSGLVAYPLVSDHRASSSIVAPVQRLPADRLRAVDLDLPRSPPPTATTPDVPPAPAPELPAITITTAKSSTRPLAPDAPPLDAQAPAIDADALLREAALLEKARADIARDPASSLRALDEHREGFGDGQLAAERELLAIDALAHQGRAAEARSRAQAFLARFPSSPYADRVRRIAGTNP